MSAKFNINIAHFQVVESIGTGLYGQVYMVEEKSTKDKFAAKVTNLECSESSKQKIFSTELSHLKSIQNPAIIKCIGFSLKNFIDEDYPTIITEFMPNHSLHKILEKESLSKSSVKWNSTKKFINILGIALGMQYLHSKGIINRNLKSSNVLLDENFYPHICDFSIYKLVKATSTNFKETDTCTSIYTAPEVFLNKNYTNKVDVYSFSYLVYEIILGRPIIMPSDNLTDFIKGITEGKRPDLSMIKISSVKEFLEKCWSKDPSNRPSFDRIIEIIGNTNFYTLFSINKKEVVEYVNHFPNDFKGKKFILGQLNADIEADQKVVKKLHDRKNPFRMVVILVLTYIIYSFLKQFFKIN